MGGEVALVALKQETARPLRIRPILDSCSRKLRA